MKEDNTQQRIVAVERFSKWSGRSDLNTRHPGPKPGALPGCATPRL